MADAGIAHVLAGRTTRGTLPVAERGSGCRHPPAARRNRVKKVRKKKLRKSKERLFGEPFARGKRTFKLLNIDMSTRRNAFGCNLILDAMSTVLSNYAKIMKY